MLPIHKDLSLENKSNTENIAPEFKVPDLKVEVRTFPEIEQKWIELLTLSKANYFQSGAWQKLWFKYACQAGHQPHIIHISGQGNSYLMSSFVLGSSRALKFIPRRTAFLNQSGDPELDVVCSEGCHPMTSVESDSREVSIKFFSYLIDVFKVQEIVIDSVPADLTEGLKKSALDLGLVYFEAQKSWHHWVDLKSIREKGETHLNSLTSRSRGLIRKSIQAYTEKYGPMSVQYATSAQKAKEWFDALIKLNISRLDLKETVSSFRFPLLAKFHNELIDEAFLKNEIAMVRVMAGAATVGYIYGFLHNNGLYIYQSGFDFNLDMKSRPGLVCHNLLAEDALKKGLDCYDFLAGDYQYKKSLSNAHGKLVWVRLQQPGLVLWLDQNLRRLKRQCKIFISRFLN